MALFTRLFDLQVAQTTLESVAMLLAVILLGYFLRRSGMLSGEATHTVSALVASLFLPAYNLNHVAHTFTVDLLGQNLLLLGVSCVFCAAIIFLGWLLGRLLGRTDFERKSLYYIFAFSNTGFFGYPVVQGVFGDEMLGRFIIFCIPVAFIGNFYACGLFATKSAFSVKRAVLAPVNVSSMIGMVLGLTGLTAHLPAFATEAIAVTGDCMSPCAMILTGLVLGAFPLKELVCHGKAYLISSVRLLGLPLVTVPLLYLVGLRGENFFFCAVASCLPVGLNSVVYPEANGFDASTNAKTAFVSFVMSLLALPMVFSVIMMLKNGISL